MLHFQYDFEREKLKNRANRSTRDSDAAPMLLQNRRDQSEGGGSKILRRRTVEADDKSTNNSDDPGWKLGYGGHANAAAVKKLESIDPLKELGILFVHLLPHFLRYRIFTAIFAIVSNEPIRRLQPIQKDPNMFVDDGYSSLEEGSNTEDESNTRKELKQKKLKKLNRR